MNLVNECITRLAPYCMGLIRYEEVNVESTRSGILDSFAISAREGISATFNCGLATVSVKLNVYSFLLLF